jgi:hypothetical protein
MLLQGAPRPQHAQVRRRPVPRGLVRAAVGAADDSIASHRVQDALVEVLKASIDRTRALSELDELTDKEKMKLIESADQARTSLRTTSAGSHLPCDVFTLRLMLLAHWQTFIRLASNAERLQCMHPGASRIWGDGGSNCMGSAFHERSEKLGYRGIADLPIY